MNVLVINASPKVEKSNSYKLTTAFINGLNSRENNSIKVIEVSKLNIKNCLGCYSCWTKTPGKCVIQDDMADVIEDIIWADIIIYSFPLFYYSVPGSLKTLIDRQLPMNLPTMKKDSELGGHPSRYDTSNKRYVIISTCGFYTANGNYDSVISMFNRVFNKEYTKILCGQGELFRVKELDAITNKYLKHVEEAGEEFIDGSISEKTQKKLSKDLFPRKIFEAMANASWKKH